MAEIDRQEAIAAAWRQQQAEGRSDLEGVKPAAAVEGESDAE